LREQTASLTPYPYPSNYFLEQRVNTYRAGGYRLEEYAPYQAVLSYGKPVGCWWWLVGLISGVGLLWYGLILLFSGFMPDRVYLVLERDGTLYEDGAGSAHVRRLRSRLGRRWGLVGVLVFFVALLVFLLTTGVGLWGLETYRPALQAAYPEISLFEGESAASAPPSAEEVKQAERAVWIFSASFSLSLVFLWFGLNLAVVGYLHGAAYACRVLPLPTLESERRGLT
jgi:hypothetical protein